MNRLSEKIAVVTGAGGDIGREIAVQFAKEGAAVVCQDLNKATAVESAKAVEQAGGRSLVWECDVADSTAIDEMFDAAASSLGTVNVLINNAGVDRVPGDGMEESSSPLEQMSIMTDEAWSKMLAIHLNGAFYCTRSMLKRLAAEGAPGSVVCMSSIAGLSGWGPLHYATAKGGLLGFVKSLARMLAPFGIRANAVCPGVIDTAMTAGVPQPMIEGLKAITPAGRMGNVSDIAAATLYLASDESDFVTGQAISPNGGLVI